MKYILGPNEVREADRTAMQKSGLPSSTLMENAARGVFDLVMQEMTTLAPHHPPRWLIFCGSGNNGADGYALGRIASSIGHEVCIIASTPLQECNEECRMQRDACEAIDSISVASWPARPEPQFRQASIIVVDALLGTGQSGKLRSPLAELVSFMNELHGLKVAVDISTGLDPASGRSRNDSFRADITATMGALKPGHLLLDGPAQSGRISVVNLGVPASWYRSELAYVDADLAAEGLPIPGRLDHKYDRGRLLAIAGSENMPGAAALVSAAALRSGIGLVNLVSSGRALDSVRYLSPPEIIAIAFDTSEGDTQVPESLSYAANNCTIQIVGPGLGRITDWLDHATRLLEMADRPLLLDADALNSEVLRSLDIVNRNSMTILTPHHGEAARISGFDAREIAEDTISAARAIAREWRSLVVLKGAPTVIAHVDGRCWINGPGNPGMATAGSGDVLSGTIGGMVGSRPDSSEREQLGALLSAVWCHSRAADVALEKSGSPHALHATDFVNTLPIAIEELLHAGSGSA